MESKVRPTSNCILWGVLPSLQPISMTEIMGGFPIIEGLVAILYRRIYCSKYVGAEEDVESTNWLHGERCSRSVGTDQHGL